MEKLRYLDKQIEILKKSRDELITKLDIVHKSADYNAGIIDSMNVLDEYLQILFKEKIKLLEIDLKKVDI